MAAPVHEAYAIEAIAPDDVWLVGDTLAQGSETTLTLHWDGSTWTQVPSPGTGFLSSVSAVTSDDVWAVGSTNFKPIALHWDGTSWKSVATPPVKNDFAGLYDVDARASDDVWATGYVSRRAIVEHWDGSRWSRVAFPHYVGGGHPEPHGVVAIAPDDAWIVGEHYSTEGYRGLIGKWDGSAWTKAAQPRPPGSFVTWQLAQISGARADDLWAVGGYYDVDGWDYLLLDHWDGERWSRLPLEADPDQPKHGDFTSVDARTANDVWAVGRRSARHDRGLIEHWDGSAWHVVASPNPPDTDDVLYAVSADTASDAWAICAADSEHEFLEHWDGSTWSLVAFP